MRAQTPKLTVFEAVGPWGDPFDQAQELQFFANEIDKAAAKFGVTELEAFQVLKPLGLSSIQEFAALKDYGLRIIRRGTSWALDSREFRRWTGERIKQLSHKPRPTPSVDTTGTPTKALF
ncbi:MAG: hypothetical protein LKI77_02535 [Bifidobacterium sp.]|jgi:hypothetical protein|nr:hypothetical protein [Bifidobacterium sp.]